MSDETPRAGGGAVLRWSLLAFALFLMATNSNVIFGVLPEIARDLHASVGQVAVSITLYALVIALISPVVSIVVPAWSRTGLMAAGLVVALLGMVVAALAPDLVTFTVGRVVAALGGAALVPTATAAGAAIVGPERRGAAIAFVSSGFTLATAVGSPLGTAVAAASSWRVPLLGMVGLGIGLLIALLLFVRRVPVSPPIGLTQRLTVLGDPRILLPLLSTFLILCGLNVVYIFSAIVTGFQGTLLAGLLLVFGVLAVVGNVISGPLTDRYGSFRVGVAFMILQVAALGSVALVHGNFAGLTVAFLVWGFAAFGSGVPVQHRLIAVDPRRASTAISWYSTALYLGVSAAPLLGAAALTTGSPPLIPAAGALVTLLGVGAFLLGFRNPRTGR